MRYVILATGLVALLAACSSSGDNPFDTVEDTEETTDEDTTDDGDAIDSDRTLPPGTASPSPETTIFRTEETSDDSGNGYAEGFAYDSASDTFTVDGLAFDGDNVYSRDAVVGSLGPFAVYEADESVTDSFDGDVVGQFTYKALYGVSDSGNTEFAIVRTGTYADYGFGGFIYQRNTTVTLPTTGQATYSGDYAGLRDFAGTGGLQYVTGEANMAIDFDDFNSGNGVSGDITNRRVYDTDGNDVTDAIITAINTESDASIGSLPTLVFAIGPDTLDENGELAGELFSSFVNDEGSAVEFESGTFYGLIAGDDADEIVGMVVVEGELGDVTARETGGFIVYR